jgi:hypothetical protein
MTFEDNMTETYTTRVRSLLPKPGPYPNVHTCIGAKVGYFHGKIWWHAIREARADFEAIRRDIVD